MWIVRLALNRPYTFVVMALLIVVLGVTSIRQMRSDISMRVDNQPMVVDGTDGRREANNHESTKGAKARNGPMNCRRLRLGWNLFGIWKFDLAISDFAEPARDGLSMHATESSGKLRESELWRGASKKCYLPAGLSRVAGPSPVGRSAHIMGDGVAPGGSADTRCEALRLFPGGRMTVDDSPQTRVSLLVRLRDGTNQPAWREFVRIYGPVVYGFARKRGLQDADAADLMQDVMRSVSTAVERLEYDRDRGTFRGWLFTITRNKVFNFLSARRIRPQGSGNTTANLLLAEQPDRPGESDEWELEYQRRLAAQAMDQIQGEFQPATWKAFWLTAVDGLPATEAGKQTGLSSGAVYVAKSRVLARLKDEVEALRQREDN